MVFAVVGISLLGGIGIGIGIGAVIFSDATPVENQVAQQPNIPPAVTSTESPLEEPLPCESIETSKSETAETPSELIAPADNDEPPTREAVVSTTEVVKPTAGRIALESIPEATPNKLDASMSGFLKSHCQDCHSGESPEGGLSLDSEAVAFDDPEVRRRWSYLFDRVAQGEMPPESAEAPTANDKETFLQSLGGVLTRADLDQREVILRRVNRNEYTNSVNDMFGIEADVSRVLLNDSTENGFDNIGSKLSVSSEQLQTYVDAADIVLDQVFGPAQAPRTLNRTINLATSKRTTVTATSGERILSDGVVLFSGSKYLPIYEGAVHYAGNFRVRAKVRAEQSATPIFLHIKGGITGQISGHSVDFFDVPPGKVTTLEFVDRARERSDTLGFALIGGNPSWSVDAANYTGAGVFIGDITVEGSIDTWTESRKRLLGNIDPSKGTIADIESVLRQVARRAFRRSVADTEIAPYVSLAKASLDDGGGFEKSLRLALKGILCAPEFLYLDEPIAADLSEINGDRLNDVLASRLSYFLWSSIPDEEILSLAEQDKLADPAVLKSQLARMLADPKAERFIENFAGQWLRVRDIDFTVPDRVLYPEFNQLLRRSMIDETYAFFREILNKNLSVQNFVDSDFLMLNQPLAEFYGIDGVKGLKIRRVPRPENSLRGGVMTQASVLKVSADGTRTSPVLRGVWIMNHLFGKPSPPPRSSVDIVQPDIRGASTIREQLAKHRADASCSRCHNKIDPPGFASESFDVIGAERDWYRVRKGGKYIKKKLHPHSSRNVLYKQGPDVDASGSTPDGRQFTNVREYKRLLLTNETAMPASMASLLMSYSLGRELGFSDRQEIEQIVAQTRASNFGLKSIIEAVVLSKAFRSP